MAETHEDVAKAEEFIALHANNVLFDPLQDNWFVFANNSGWKVDTANTRARMVIDLGVTKEKNIASTCRTLKLYPEMHQSEWDTQAHLIGFRNGVYDLLADEFRDPQPDDFFIRRFNVDYPKMVRKGFEDVTVKELAPRWLKFLDEIFLKREELITYVQGVLGRAYTGFHEPHHVYFLRGDGRNGKGVLLRTLKAIAKDYTWAFDVQKVLGDKRPDISHSLAAFKGRRLVYASELNKRLVVDTEQLKRLSGGDDITADRKYGSEEEITPTWHMFILANRWIELADDGSALWDRVVTIPFDARFEEKDQDRTLEDTLKQQGSGIAYWLVQGARDYMKRGRQLPPMPKECARVREQFRENARDPFDTFLHERTERVDSPNVWTLAEDLYADYTKWCEASGIEEKYRIAQHNFIRKRLGERFQQKRLNSRTRKAEYGGVRLKPVQTVRGLDDDD